MKNEIKYFVYLRKSTESEERQVLSIQSQKDQVKKRFPDLKVVDFLIEKHSAFKPYNRPIFAEMIDRIKGGEAQGIIAWHPDRLSRNEIDASTITYLVRTKVIHDLKFGSYNFDNSPEGIMMLQLALSQSQYFSSKLGIDVKRGMKKKAELGWFPGPARAGYMNEKYAEKGYKKVLIDPIRFPLIQKAFKTILAKTHSPAQVLEMLNHEWGYTSPKKRKIGGKPMRQSQYYRLLCDPFYCGVYTFDGKTYKGKHQPMITEAEFEQVQKLIGKPGNMMSPNKRKFDDVFYGLFKCGECGGYISPEVKIQTICTNCKHKFASRHRDNCPKCKTKIIEMTNPTQLRYVYYSCKKNKDPKCSQKIILTEKKLLEQFGEILKGIKISEKMTKWFVKQLNKVNNKELKDQSNILEALKEKLSDIQKRKQNLLQMKISPNNMNGEILSDEDYMTQKTALDKEAEIIQSQISSADEKAKQWAELAIDTFNFACYAPYHFAHGDYETRKNILVGFGSNITLKDGEINVILPHHLEIIKKVNNLMDNRKEIIEPTNIVLYKEKTGVNTPAFSKWHGW